MVILFLVPRWRCGGVWTKGNCQHSQLQVKSSHRSKIKCAIARHFVYSKRQNGLKDGWDPLASGLLVVNHNSPSLAHAKFTTKCSDVLLVVLPLTSRLCVSVASGSYWAASADVLGLSVPRTWVRHLRTSHDSNNVVLMLKLMSPFHHSAASYLPTCWPALRSKRLRKARRQKSPARRQSGCSLCPIMDREVKSRASEGHTQ